MKANSHLTFTNISNLIHLYFDSLARSLSIVSIYLPKVGMLESIFTASPRLPIVTKKLKPDDANVNLIDSAQPTLCDRNNTGNHKLQKPQLARRHRSIDWRWQSRLMNCF